MSLTFKRDKTELLTPEEVDANFDFIVSRIDGLESRLEALEVVNAQNLGGTDIVDEYGAVVYTISGSDIVDEYGAVVYVISGNDIVDEYGSVVYTIQ